MTLEILTPKSPRWDLFVRLLEQTLSDGGCSNNHQYAEAVMAELGGIDIARTLKFFDQHGGYCDCEVLLNVYARGTDDKPTLEEIEQMMRELEQEGLIRRTGEIRNGRPVYVKVELGSPVNLNVPATLQ